ncbi:MAG: acyl-CoA dehydrogenase family protein [Maricaulaceae bacterium]
MSNLFYECILLAMGGVVAMMIEYTKVAPSLGKNFSICKSCEVIDNCQQFLGGNGYTAEYWIPQFYPDARVQRINGAQMRS